MFEDTGVCVGVGPSMSTRGILGKKDFYFILGLHSSKINAYIFF